MPETGEAFRPFSMLFGKETAMENRTENWILTQVGVVVKDVEKVVERLGVLGIGPFEKMALPPEREEYFRGKRMDADFDIRGTRMGNVQLELIQPLSGDSPHKEFLETKGEGIQHVMYQVDNLEETVKELTEKGVEILLDAKFPGGHGIAYIDLGAANIVIELSQKR
jgi:methylmalonyl-CoA/ethylmalonyl-CoA epimerase